MKILIVGGTGVLSGAVLAEAQRQKIEVTIVTRGKRNIPMGCISIVSNKEDYRNIAKSLKQKYDAIIDFLCFTKDELENSFKFYSQYTNQYFFVSSSAVYDSRIGECDENSPKVLPMWQYSIDKWDAEQKLLELSQYSSCNYTIIRPCVTYDDTRIPYGISPVYGYHWTLCARILAGKPIITWNNGENRCNMMRVEDFAVGVVGLIGNEKAYNDAFNICGDETPSWNEVLVLVEEYLQKKAIRVNLTSEFYAEQLPNRAGEILGGRSIDSFNSNAKIKSVVPEFKQTITIKDGICRTLDAYKSQNYQRGIDWKFDAETDRVISLWRKQKGGFTKDMNIRFVDYLGNATSEDRFTYFSTLYHDDIWMKILRKLIKLYSKVKIRYLSNK